MHLMNHHIHSRIWNSKQSVGCNRRASWPWSCQHQQVGQRPQLHAESIGESRHLLSSSPPPDSQLLSSKHSSPYAIPQLPLGSLCEKTQINARMEGLLVLLGFWLSKIAKKKIHIYIFLCVIWLHALLTIEWMSQDEALYQENLKDSSCCQDYESHDKLTLCSLDLDDSRLEPLILLLVAVELTFPFFDIWGGFLKGTSEPSIIVLQCLQLHLPLLGIRWAAHMNKKKCMGSLHSTKFKCMSSLQSTPFIF